MRRAQSRLSARDRSGVSLRYVKEGVYEKGSSRTNPIEARAVVDEVVRRLGDPEESSSIGVVGVIAAIERVIVDV